MRPSFWSKNANELLSLGWHQFGDKITYEPSPYNKEIQELNPKYASVVFMQLSYVYTFAEPNDEVFCAYTIPYTYTNL